MYGKNPEGDYVLAKPCTIGIQRRSGHNARKMLSSKQSYELEASNLLSPNHIPRNEIPSVILPFDLIPNNWCALKDGHINPNVQLTDR